MIWPLILASFFLISCNEIPNDSQQKTDKSRSASDCQSTQSAPPAPAASGQLTFKAPNDVDPCSVNGYVVGNKDQPKVQQFSDGNYYINNVPDGKRDVVITAGTINTGAAFSQESRDHGITELSL